MAEKILEQAQKDLPDLLDAVEIGEDVVVVDPDVLDGNWTWITGEDGQLEFRARRETS
jgi:hypothetical protein